MLWDHLQADVGLVQEAFLEPELGQVVGRPFSDDPSSPSRWGTYVWSRGQGPSLDAPERTPVGAASLDAIEDSYPGTTAVARVDLAGSAVHLVSVYGALTGHPTRNAVDTMHRILSDFSDLIRSDVPLLMAGDFNITTQPYASGDPGQWWHGQDATVFGRLESLGMVDLIRQFLPKGHQGEPGCPCGRFGLDPGCGHVRTTRHRNRDDSTRIRTTGRSRPPPSFRSCSIARSAPRRRSGRSRTTPRSSSISRLFDRSSRAGLQRSSLTPPGSTSQRMTCLVGKPLRMRRRGTPPQGRRSVG